MHLGMDKQEPEGRDRFGPCEYVNFEQVFSDAWLVEAAPNHQPIDSVPASMGWRRRGRGLLETLMVQPVDASKPSTRGGGSWANTRTAFVITPRDRKIVATIIQWLGTNVGMGFLHEALRRCGLYIGTRDETRQHHDQWGEAAYWRSLYDEQSAAHRLEMRNAERAVERRVEILVRDSPKWRRDEREVDLLNQVEHLKRELKDVCERLSCERGEVLELTTQNQRLAGLLVESES